MARIAAGGHAMTRWQEQLEESKPLELVYDFLADALFCPAGASRIRPPDLVRVASNPVSALGDPADDVAELGRQTAGAIEGKAVRKERFHAAAPASTDSCNHISEEDARRCVGGIKGVVHRVNRRFPQL